MSISHNIFQTFPNKNLLPYAYKDNIEEIKKLNPDWQHHLFDDSEVFKFFEENLEKHQFNLIKKINPKYGVVFADIFRYLVIYKFGGVYLDIKSTLNLPLSHVIQKTHNFLISQWRNKPGEEFSGIGLHRDINYIPGGEFQQWHVVAEPQHPFLREVLEQIFKNIENYNIFTFGVGRIGVLRLSGPICYTKVINSVIKKYPCQMLNIEDLGFQYSIFRNTSDRSAHSRGPTHYSKIKEPIVFHH